MFDISDRLSINRDHCIEGFPILIKGEAPPVVITLLEIAARQGIALKPAGREKLYNRQESNKKRRMF